MINHGSLLNFYFFHHCNIFTPNHRLEFFSCTVSKFMRAILIIRRPQTCRQTTTEQTPAYLLPVLVIVSVMYIYIRLTLVIICPFCHISSVCKLRAQTFSDRNKSFFCLNNR